MTASKSSSRTRVYSSLEPARSTYFPFRPSSYRTQMNHHPHHTYPSHITLSAGSTANASPFALSSTKAQHNPLFPGTLSPSSSAERATTHGHPTSTTSNYTPSNLTHSTPPIYIHREKVTPYLHTSSPHVSNTKFHASAAR